MGITFSTFVLIAERLNHRTTRFRCQKIINKYGMSHYTLIKYNSSKSI